MAYEATVDGLSAEGVCRLMQEFGFRAEMITTADGNPLIRSSAGGWNFIVLLYKGANDTAYSSCSLAAGLNDVRISTGFANHWNANLRFTKAYADSDSNPMLELDVFLSGVSKTYLRRCFAIWDAFLPKFFEAAASSQRG